MQPIAEWLEKLGLGRYAPRFAENDIDLSVLRDVTDQHLKDIGVLLGDRRKMLRAIEELADGPTPSRPAAAIGRRPPDGAERRQLTVMFCGLVSSTTLSDRLDPEDFRAIVRAYYRCCTELIECNGGFVATHMGDEVLAYFGYPQAHEHDAERAVRAGLALVEAMPKVKTVTAGPLRARVGIATGLVVVGDLIDAGAAQELPVVGETPNLAARLQALAEPGAVVIASSTRRLTGGLFEYRDLGFVPLKGFAKNVPAWQVRGEGTAESRFEALRAATTPLVGRDEEFDVLLRRWEQTKRGDGVVVLISGEPGIGKSRIAHTVVDRLGAEQPPLLRYFCSPHHQDSALYPSISQLERAAGFRRDDTNDQRLAKLEAVLSKATDDLSEAMPLLADLLSIPTGDHYPPLNLTPPKRKEKTFRALLAQVEGLAAQQAVLMVFEDVQWSDPTTRESLDLLIDCVPALRVLVIITFRPEFTPPWIGCPHVVLLNLSRLPPRQCAEMITRLTGGKGLPREIADQIIDRTDGVPLFIEELTKSVVESGLVTDSGDHYAMAGPVSSLAIPTTLHASLLARLDRLAPIRGVVQIGAALGRSFAHELISAVAAMPQSRVDDALAQLVNSELIYRRGTPPDAEYTFKHALVQDAAYSTLLRNRRQQIHARIASTLEKQFPEIVATQPQLMAQHCVEAGLIEKAIAFFTTAGQQAIARSAMAEAVSQLMKGLRLIAKLPDSPLRKQQELDLQIALGPARIATSGFSAPDVGETYTRARALAEQLDRPEYLVSLIYGQWAFHCIRSEYELAMSLAEQLEEIGATRNDVAALLLGHFAHAGTHLRQGEFLAAYALYEQCHKMSEYRTLYVTMTGADQYLIALSQLALTLVYLGRIDQGRSRISQALSAARQLGHVNSLAYVLVFVCLIEWLTSSPQDLKRHGEDLMALSEEHGLQWLGWGMAYCGASMTTLGQAQKGHDLITKALSTIRGMGYILGTPLVLCFLGEAHSKLGRPLDGLDCLAEAAQIIEMTDERYDEAELHRLRGDLLNATSDRAAAEENYHRALTVARHQGGRFCELRAATSLACLWHEQGKRAEARALLAPVYNCFSEGFAMPALQDAKTLLDQLT